MIGNRIKEIRKQKKITQKQLSDAIGIKDRSMITRYEQGAVEIRSGLLPKIADALNVPIAKLFEQ